MSNITHVYFDGLGIDFNLPSVAFSVFGYDIHWYGIIIAFGFALAVLYGGRKAYKWKMSLDGMTDVLIWGTLLGIICARLYYVAFEWDYYSQHLNEIPAIWNGGIAIYGGIIGAGLPVYEATGSMIIDIGGGTTDVAVLSLGGIACCNSIKVGGEAMDDAIVSYMRKTHNLLIGERTAEDIKLKIGSAMEYDGEAAMEVRGRNLNDGLPGSVEITSSDIRSVLEEPVSQIIAAIKETLEVTLPELLNLQLFI